MTLVYTGAKRNHVVLPFGTKTIHIKWNTLPEVKACAISCFWVNTRPYQLNLNEKHFAFEQEV